MKHRISPKIDCVFKALLGSEQNLGLLLHFLNAILAEDLPQPVTAVEILNPYNDKEYQDDKLTIVDVKAKDAAGQLYQVEIQLLNFRHLPQRIIYGWADIYSQQLQNGDGYARLQATYAIWLLDENLTADAGYCRDYKFRDAQGRPLAEHGGIWLLELNKFRAAGVESERERWIKFFQEGERLNDAALPDWMTTQEMRQAMETLRQFSEKERNYHAYQARQNFLRQQSCFQEELEEERQARQLAQEKEAQERQARQLAQEKEAQERQARQLAQQEKEQERQARQLAQQEKDTALQEKAAALAEIERLKALLASRNSSG